MKFYEFIRKSMMTAVKDKRLRKLEAILLKGKTWRYLRYIHLRDSLKLVAHDVESVVVAGAGHGYAEIALAVEFPHIQFYLTDIITDDYPNYHRSMDICWKWHINNVNFGVWNVLESIDRKFDLVCSTEMLEHIENDVLAAKKMREVANKYVYCLVPFGDIASNSNKALRKRVMERHGHFVYGYDEKSLVKLFPTPLILSGAYFDDAGQLLRTRLTDMTVAEIGEQQDTLAEMAQQDLQNRIPKTPKEGQGIRILSRVDK